MTMRMTSTAKEWIAERQARCELAISKEVKRSGCREPTIICLPELGSWKQVCEIDNVIKEIRIFHVLANKPFFKIPFYINDVESFILMLFREQL